MIIKSSIKCASHNKFYGVFKLFVDARNLAVDKKTEIVNNLIFSANLVYGCKCVDNQTV